MPAAGPEYRKDYIATLDGLRAIAVLLVLWQHTPAYSIPLITLEAGRAIGIDLGLWPLQLLWLRNGVINAGYLGVDLFFVLSGFLITRILLVDRARGIPLRHFLVRRFLRIFPIYYLTIGVLAWVDPHPEQFWCALYLSNFYYPFGGFSGPLQHSWSLAVEEHFYLAWPFIASWCTPRWSMRLMTFVLLPASFMSLVWLAAYGEGGAATEQLAQYGTMFRVSSLGAGALIAYHEPVIRADARRRSSLWFGVGCVVLGAGVRAFEDRIPGIYIVARQFGMTLLTTGIVLGAIAVDPIPGNVITRVLRSAPLRFIGRISYGLYLYHFVLNVEYGLTGRPLEHTPLAGELSLVTGLTFVVATVSFFFIERPCLRLAARFRGR